MEDAFTVQKVSAPSSPRGSSPPASPRPNSSHAGNSSPLPGHYYFDHDLTLFGIFDGHGGREVADHCSEQLHQHFAHRLAEMDCSGAGGTVARRTTPHTPDHSKSHPVTATLGLHEAVGSLLKPKSPLHPDHHAARAHHNAAASGAHHHTAAPGTHHHAAAPGITHTAAGDAGTTPSSSSHPPPAAESISSEAHKLELPHSSYVQAVEDALHYAFRTTDEELMGTETGEDVGATAVVAVLGKEHIWIAHCGDSRAVMQRSGEAVPVTQDHKPDREDEAARVRAAGGKVVYTSGTYRVNGMLAMSRAIGDHFLRPYVIAEPEITVLHRSSQDEVLIIATDGLWDVFGNSEATTLASRCISRSMDRGMSRHGACRVAASVLTKVALERGSRDNITVIVVDITLQPTRNDEEGNCQSHVVPSSYPEGSVNEGDESGEADASKVVNPNNHSVGTHFLIKSRPSSEGGDSGAGRKHSAGDSTPSACHSRPLKRCNSGRPAIQSQAMTASPATAQAKLSRFHTPISSSDPASPNPRCWTTLMLGCSPRPASAATGSHKRHGFPSFQMIAADVSTTPEPLSSQPSLILPWYCITMPDEVSTDTVSDSMFAAAIAALGSAEQQQDSSVKPTTLSPFQSSSPINSAQPADLEAEDSFRPLRLDVTDSAQPSTGDADDTARPRKMHRSSSAAAGRETSQAQPGAAGLSRTMQVRGSACLLRGQSMNGYGSPVPNPSDVAATHTCPDISNDVMSCWGRVAIESYGSGGLTSVWQQPRLLL